MQARRKSPEGRVAYLSWSATLATPALPQASSCGPPLGAQLRPPGLLPELDRHAPWSGMTSESWRCRREQLSAIVGMLSAFNREQLSAIIGICKFC
jgi:hypothetical protein